MLDFLQPQTVFYDLFDRLAAHVQVGAGELHAFAVGYPESEHRVQAIRDEEHLADEVMHELLTRLSGNTQTPIDREDVHALAGELDDILDDIDAAAKRFALFHVTAVEPSFVRQTEVLEQSTQCVVEVVQHLRTKRHPVALREKLIEVHRLESVGDDNHHDAISRLFDGSHPPLYVLKWKALYELVESAIDKCEDVGNSVHRIVLRNA